MKREIKLKLGSQKRTKGWITLDKFGNPNIKHDLNNYPWPFPDSNIMEVEAFDTLNHLKDIQKAFSEIYRICCNNAKIHISVPFWRCDMFKHIWHYWVLKPGALKELDISVVEKSMTYKNSEPPFKFRLEKIYHKRKYGLFRYLTFAKYEVIK